MGYQNIFYDKNTNKLHLWDDKNGYKLIPYQHYGYIKHPQGNLTTIDGQKVKKVTSWSKEDAENGNIFEADLQPEVRTLIDIYHESDEPSIGHSVMYLDIEIKKEGRYSTPQQAANTISSICFYVDSLKQYFVFILDENSRVKDIKNQNVQVFGYKTERDLLKSFLIKYQEIKPTILTGWNIDYFDIPYLYNRMCNVLSEKVACMLSPIGVVKWSDRDEKYTIAGVSCLDYLLLYKKFKLSEKPSYTLEAIAQDELGTGKIKYDGDLDHLYNTDIMQFIKYNMVDVKLVKDLDDKKQYIDLVRSICHKGHVPYEHIHQTSAYLDGAALTYTKNLGIVAPNKKHPKKLVIAQDHRPGSDKIYLSDKIPDDVPKSGLLKFKKTKTAEFKVEFDGYKDNYFILSEPLKESALAKYDLIVDLPGAYVKDPVVGLHDWMYDLDLESLYPGVIRTLNISPETKVGSVINWDSDIFIKKQDFVFNVSIKKHVEKINAKDFESWLKTKNYSVSANGVLYTLDKVGLIPAILSTWFAERKEYKNLMKQYGKAGDDAKYKYYYIRQWVTKIMLNSFYGVLGLRSFRYYDIDNASAVTSTGQSVIKFSARVANNYYNKIIGGEIKDYVTYIDTDSLFLSAVPLVKKLHPETDINDNEKMSKHILDIADKVQKYINESYNIYAEKFHNVKDHNFFIKQELIGKTGIWFAKKRYAIWIINKEGINTDELEVKGLDVVRSDFPASFRSFLECVLKNILDKHDSEQITSQILEFKNSLKSISLLDVMFPTGVKKVQEYQSSSRHIFEIEKGTPIHSKSAIYYNDIMDYHKIDTVPHIYSGDKIKWTYLKKNPFNIDTLALKGYEDPQVIYDFVGEYIDRTKNFESAFLNKLQDFYDALGWGKLILNDTVNDFFSF